MKRLAIILCLSAACSTFDAGKYAPPTGEFPGSGGDDTGGTSPEEEAELDCDEQPMLNWDNFGQGFMIQNCNGCHHSESPDRYGAPPDAIFDDVADVWARRGGVLSSAGGANPWMPPNGGTKALEREKLEIWLRCGTPGT
jgi:hypothetical protein